MKRFQMRVPVGVETPAASGFVETTRVKREA